MPPKRKNSGESTKKKKKTKFENFFTEDSQKIVESDCESNVSESLCNLEGTGTQQFEDTDDDDDDKKNQSRSSSPELVIDQKSSSQPLFQYANIYHDVNQVAYVLKDWLYKKSGLDTSKIPKNILDKIILDTKDGKIFKEKIKNEKDKKIQQEFLEHIFESLIEERREAIVIENIDDNLPIFQGCFRKAVENFNNTNLDILSEVTPENMPDVATIQDMLECSDQIAECVKPEEIEAIRKFILNQQELRILNSCDCCIKTYINNDLQNHKNIKFALNFQKTYLEKESLTKNPIYCSNFIDFKKAIGK